MKQSVFYRCMIESGEKCFALRTRGYTEGGIGLVKEPLGWVATHIPTGAKITPYFSQHSTARLALVEAENLIAESKDILQAIQNVKSHQGYHAFLNDRLEQLLVEKED